MTPDRHINARVPTARCGKARSKTADVFYAFSLKKKLFTFSFYRNKGYGRWIHVKGVIKLSGKSPRSSDAKKPGKSIIEKRAEKRAKAESNEPLFAKPRKNAR